MRWLIAAAVSLLTTAFVGLSAVGGWFYWDRVETRGEESARATLPPLAAKEVPHVLGYDYQTVERSMDDVYPQLTPAYREVFKKRSTTTSSRKPAKAGRQSGRHRRRGSHVGQTQFSIGAGVREPNL